MQEIELAKKNLIIKGITGSKLYGTETGESDIDYVGVFIPPQEYIYGLKRCEQVIVKEKNENGVLEEYTCYSLDKYIRLAIANNPNILSLLFTPTDRLVYVNDFGLELLENKSLFLSKKAYHSFRGYAHAQRRKITSKEQVLGHRKDLIEKYGYDVKFAMHLLRLLYEGLDILVGKELVYPCPMRTLFSGIRRGEKSLQWVLDEADRLEKLIDEQYVKSDLQYCADEAGIEKLQMSMFERFWNRG